MKFAIPVLLVSLFSAFANGPAVDQNRISMIKKKLAALIEIQDNNQFIVEFTSFLASNRYEMVIRKGDRAVIGKAMLVFAPNGEFHLRSAADEVFKTKILMHFITDKGEWVQSNSTPENATHFLMSTANFVFVTNVKDQRIAIVER